MAENYSLGRINIFKKLCERRPDLMNGRFWMLEPRSMRFKHGESIAELKVPYHMGADDETVIEEAVLALASLAVKRYELIQTKEAQALPILKLQPLKEKTFRTDIFIADSFEKRLALDILSSTPYLDSAIISAWLVPEGHGRRFTKWVSELFDKILKEEAATGADERTSYLALLSIINTVRKKKERIKDLRARGLSYEKLDLALSLAVFVALREALKEFFDRLSSQGASYYNPLSEALLLSSMTPRQFLSIPATLLSVSINPYGISQETFSSLCTLSTPDDFKEGSGGIAELMERAEKGGRGDSMVAGAVNAQHDVNRFREEALRYIMEFDLPGSHAQAILYEVYNDDRMIKNLLGDAKLTQNLLKAIEEVRKAYSRDAQKAEAASSFIRFLSGFKKGLLGGLLGGRRGAADAFRSVLDGFFACLVDDHIERFTLLSRGVLSDRRTDSNQNALKDEYSRGRLYRFSTDDRPVLKSLEIEEEGQLFVDMKDFTRKTLKVKEIAMAEFMREHFYMPILSAASRYKVGAGIVKDERGIRLTNLPGDAAIFSGGVTFLVQLAKDIQQVIRRYKEQLEKRMPPSKDKELLDEVHRRSEARREELKGKRAQLNKALEMKEEGVEVKLIALGEEEHRLENMYMEEIEEAVKGELEAGLYISYGAKPETMSLESRDESFGSVKVAIGEKINEASRGTYRNSSVRARLELQLETERQKRRDRKFRYPFDIFIDTTFLLRMPPELETAFEKLIATRKPAAAQALAQVMSQEYLGDLNKIISGEPFSSLRLVTTTTDIYNRGQALSQKALQAYIRETKGLRRFFKKTVNVSDLGDSIRGAFYFPAESLEFMFGSDAGKSPGTIEAFFRSGEIMFRGFEASTPTVVYEMLDQDGDFFKVLIRDHFDQWFEESRAKPEAEIF